MADQSIFDAFNPQVQEVGNVDGAPKGTSGLAPNMSGSAFWSGVGDLSTEAVKVTDSLFKTYVGNQARDKATELQDAQEGALRGLDNQQRGGQPLPGTPQNLLPPEVANADSKVASLNGARGNGKMSETYYYGRLDTLAKDLRSKYPGYRDVIDAKIEGVTGVSPANAFIKSVMGDINSRVDNDKSEKEKVITQALSHLGKDQTGTMLGLIQKFDSNPTPENKYAIMQNISDLNAKEAKYTQQVQALQLNGMQRTEREQQATTIGTDLVSKTMTDYFSGARKLAGDGQMSLADIDKSAVDMMEHPDKVDPVQAQGMLQAMQAYRQKAYTYLQGEFDKVPDGGQFSLTTSLGSGKKRDDMINSGMSRFDQLTDLFSKKEYGIVHSMTNMMTAQQSQFNTGLLNDKTVGGYMRMLDFLRTQGGNEVSKEWFTKQIGNPKLTAVESSLANYDKLTTITGVPDLRRTPSEVADDIKRTADTYGDTKVANARAGSLRDWLASIGNPNTPMEVKTSLVNNTFNDQDKDLLRHFVTDYRNERGDLVRGKYDLFGTLTSDSVVGQVSKVAASDPSVYGRYKDWTMYSAQNYLLNDISSSFKDWKNNRDMKITWHPEDHNFAIDFGRDINLRPGAEGTVPSSPGVSTVGQGNQDFYKQQIMKLNTVIGGVNRVLEGQGLDKTETQAMLINFLKRSGYDLDDHGLSRALRASTAVPRPKDQDRVP